MASNRKIERRKAAAAARQQALNERQRRERVDPAKVRRSRKQVAGHMEAVEVELSYLRSQPSRVRRELDRKLKDPYLVPRLTALRALPHTHKLLPQRRLTCIFCGLPYFEGRHLGPWEPTSGLRMDGS